jgi:PKD repeat protein
MSVDFGDGTVRPLGAANGTTSVQHVYNNTDIRSYTVTVSLLDTLGARTSASTVIVVLPQPPLGVSINFTKVGAALPVSVNFTATVTPATATVSSYLWDFGDGQSQTTTTNTATKTYTTPGTFTARVTVTTTTGQTSVGTVAVSIP